MTWHATTAERFAQLPIWRRTSSELPWDYTYEDSEGRPLCRSRFSKKGKWRYEVWVAKQVDQDAAPEVEDD